MKLRHFWVIVGSIALATGCGLSPNIDLPSFKGSDDSEGPGSTDGEAGDGDGDATLGSDGDPTSAPDDGCGAGGAGGAGGAIECTLVR